MDIPDTDYFDFTRADCVPMAEFVHALVRMGAAYRVHNMIGGWRIWVTGV